jgi:ankyrin repeat protein
VRPVSGELLAAIRANDAAAVAAVLERHPELEATLNGPLEGYGFGQTALMAAVQRGNRDMIDVLLRAGADINQKSHWWAGPFHVLDGAGREPWMPSFLIGRGAVPEIHHLVQLGMIDDVRRVLAENPSLLQARGGDGQLPLHFAQSVEMAQYLVGRGADLDARDIDHESTAAQYMIRDRQPIVRYLLRRGARADVLMAAALGDVDLIGAILDADPHAVRTRVSSEWFPMQDSRAGGTIYIWTLGGEKGAHEIAREFGHEDALGVLMARSPASLQLAAACLLEDRARASQLTGTSVEPDDRVWLLAAASRNRTEAARMMLHAGWPAVTDSQTTTALHWAAWHGNAELAKALLDRGAPTDRRDVQYHGTPRDWAEHGAREQHGRAGADFDAVLRLLP